MNKNEIGPWIRLFKICGNGQDKIGQNRTKKDKKINENNIRIKTI